MFAIITDIHGNYPALKAALQEIDNIGVNHTFCLGDMIGIGPDSNEVLDLLFSRENISMITGNHDEAVLALFNGEEYPESHSHARKHHEWIANRLDQSFISKLGSLPRYVNLKKDKSTILFTHYHIKQDKMTEHISKDPFSSIVDPSLSNISDLFSDRQEDMICFGHHHPIQYFNNLNRIFLNPGSLGCNDKSTARFAIAQVDGDELQVELKETRYDNTEFLASYSKLEVPDHEFILKVFHGDQLR